jgi:hypothetical protein
MLRCCTVWRRDPGRWRRDDEDGGRKWAERNVTSNLTSLAWVAARLEGGRSPKEALHDHRSFPRTRQVVISSVTVFLSRGIPFLNVAVAGLLWRIVYEGGGEGFGSPGI